MLIAPAAAVAMQPLHVVDLCEDQLAANDIAFVIH